MSSRDEDTGWSDHEMGRKIVVMPWGGEISNDAMTTDVRRRRVV